LSLFLAVRLAEPIGLKVGAVGSLGKVFVTASRDSEHVENTEAYANVAYSGVYFFLYPTILRLRDQTGELIDAQQSAFFIGRSLDHLEHFVVAARGHALEQPEEWEQRVGKGWPGGDALNQLTSRRQILLFLERIESAVGVARRTGMGVLFLGE
jgi:hypothetical protein